MGNNLPEALHDVLGLPVEDQFVTTSTHGLDELFLDSGYMAVLRTEDAVTITERSLADKRAVTRATCEKFAVALGIRKDDVFVALIPVQRERELLLLARRTSARHRRVPGLPRDSHTANASCGSARRVTAAERDAFHAGNTRGVHVCGSADAPCRRRVCRADRRDVLHTLARHRRSLGAGDRGQESESDPHGTETVLGTRMVSP